MNNQDDAMQDDVAARFAVQCVRAGIKATIQRQQIYVELLNSEEHPDAESIYARVKRRIRSISLDTVYRNLRTLDAHGIIQKVGAVGYRTRFDANMQPHHHFVCTACGRICDFYDNRLDGYEPDCEVLSMGIVESLHIEIRGVCATCINANQSHHAGVEHAEKNNKKGN